MTSPTVAAVTPEDIVSARELLQGVVAESPVEHSDSLSALARAPVHLKCENLQRTGSFKLRGAYVRIARLSLEDQARGVVAASAGNHAQGVALAATLLGAKSTVFMPEGVPIPKEKATRHYGAEVTLVGSSVDDAMRAAREFSAETGAVVIHPYDHRDIMAGQCPIDLELLDHVPDRATGLVPVGAAGLAAGGARGVNARRPSVRGGGGQAEQ